MPEFPRANSDRSLTTSQPRAMRNDADIQTEAKERAAIGTNALSETTNAYAKWNTAVENIQKETAMYNYKTGAQQIANDAVLDTDINGEQRYQKRMQDLRKTVIKGLDNPALENSLAPELNYMESMGGLALKQEFRKKMINHGQVIGLGNINFEVNNPNPKSEENIAMYADKMWKDGLIDEAAAYKLKVSSTQDVRYNRFLQEYREDPIGAEKKFNDGGYALDIETSEKARTKLKDLQRIYKEATSERSYDLGLGITDGTTSDKAIDAAMAANELNPNEGITKAQGLKLRARLYTDITKKMGAKEYQKTKKAIDFVFSNTADKMTMYDGVLDAYADGLDKNDYKWLGDIIKMQKTKAKKNIMGQMKDTIWDAMGWSMPSKSIEEKTDALLEYARLVASGTDAEEAGRQVMLQEQKKDHPALALDPDLTGTYSPKTGYRPMGPKVNQKANK